MPEPIQAGLWGALAASALLLGAIGALTLSVSRRSAVLVMAFGAGALVSALPEAFENGGERVGLATTFGFAAAFLLSKT